MRAVLDHVGIAVDRLDETLAFYRDALGLDVSVPEDVPSQRVRAHMLDAGGAALELLEATAPDSPITAFLAKRGPGMNSPDFDGQRRIRFRGEEGTVAYILHEYYFSLTKPLALIMPPAKIPSTFHELWGVRLRDPTTDGQLR